VVLDIEVPDLFAQLLAALAGKLMRGIRQNERELLASVAAGNIVPASVTPQKYT
jgi:hypothetical protein